VPLTRSFEWMNPTVPVLLTVTAVLVAAALPGCGEKEEPALADAGGSSGATPSTRECEGRTQEHAFDRARLVNGGRVLRVAYTESSSYPPCELRVRYLRGSLRVTPRVAYPRAGFDDLRYWCAEGRLRAAVPAGPEIVSDPVERHPARGFDARPLQRALRTGRDCVRVPVEYLD
jgi:hypothetical protein